jgi:hypothetical protein
MKPVCRYYLADGVRFSAQSTWLEVFKEEGRRVVGRHLPDTLDYYVTAAKQATGSKIDGFVRRLSNITNVADLYWFPCESGSKVLMTKNCKILQMKKSLIFKNKICNFLSVGHRERRPGYKQKRTKST